MHPFNARPLREHLVLLRPPRTTMSLVTAAALLVSILNVVFCPFEERRLRTAFPDFAAYAARVRRWI